MNEKIQVEKLVNPARWRCMICGQSACWWVTVGDDDDYISFYYCDICLPDVPRAELEN